MRRAVLVVFVALSVVAGALLDPGIASSQAPTLIGHWPSTGIPLGLALDASGRVYLPDEHNNVTLRGFGPMGQPLSVFGSSLGHEGYGVLVRSDQTILVADYYGCRVQRFAADGTPMGEFPTGGQRALYLAFDESENIYVTDDEGGAVRKFTSGGALLNQWPVNHPSGVAYTNGRVYVSEMFGSYVRIFSPTGVPQGSIYTGATWAEQMLYDGMGHLILADHGLKQLKCFTTSGTLLWTLGPTVPGYPYPVADFFSVVMAPDGTLYAGDFANRNVLMFSPLPVSTLRESFGGLKSRFRGER